MTRQVIVCHGKHTQVTNAWADIVIICQYMLNW